MYVLCKVSALMDFKSIACFVNSNDVLSDFDCNVSYLDLIKYMCNIIK